MSTSVDAAAAERSAPLGLALAVAVAAISFAAIFFRLADPMHPLVKAGLRLCFAAVLLAWPTISAYRRGRLPRSVLQAGVLAGLLYAVHFGTWVASLTLTSIAASVTLVTATPLLLALLGSLTGRDPPTRRLWASLGLAAVGLLLVGGRDLGVSPAALLGDMLAFVGAGAMAAYLLLARAQGEQLDVLAFTGLATAVGGPLLLLLALVVGAPLTGLSSAGLGWLVLAAMFPQLVGHSLLTWALRRASPTTVGIATLAEPVGSTVLGVLLLHEHPDGLVVIGCLVTLAGVALALVRPPDPDATP